MLINDLLTLAQVELASTLSHPREIVALIVAAIAAVLIVISALVKTITPMRWLLVASNVGFVAYGLLHPAWLVFALHLTLLPINLWRAIEIARVTRRVRKAATAGDLSGVWLRPYMKRRRYRAGSQVFAKGDTADHLYLLVEGELELAESGRLIEPGRIFGEIAFFAPDRRRTQTALCRTACTVLRIDETTFRSLYFQDPAFGFEIVRLIAARLSADVRRLEEKMAARDSQLPDRALPSQPAAAETASELREPN